MAHGKRYSKTFNSTSSTNAWRDNKEKMCEKTVIKQLLSNWGVLSVELQDALKYDQAVIKDDKSVEYVDKPDDVKEEVEVEVVETEVVDKPTPKAQGSLLDAIDNE
jgi:recombination protein RecT